MAYSLSHIDTCCSDYFCGYHLPVVQVLVDETTTYKDIKIALLDTDFCLDHIENIDHDVYIEAVHELFANFASLDFVPDSLYAVGNMNDSEEWDLYMYFVIDGVENELPTTD